MLNKMVKVKAGIIVLFVLSISLLFSCIVKDDKEELKENKVVEKSITKPSNIQAYTYMGEKTDKTYEWLLLNKTVNKITCKNGTIATFNYEDNSVSLSNIKLPDYCTIDFKEGYLVSLTAGSTGTVSPASQTTGYNGTISFTVTPSDGYKAEFLTNTCGGTLSGSTYTVSKVTSNKSCSITFKKNGTILSSLIKSYATSHTNGVYNEDGYRYEGSDPNNYIYMTNNSTNEKELWRIIGVFPDGENGEEVIRVRRHYEKNNYPTMAYNSGSTAYNYKNLNKTKKNLLAFNDILNKDYIAAGVCFDGGENHFPKTSMYNSLSSTYNLTNYNHVVNFKMYLGSSSSSPTLTVSGLYLMERGTTPGYTAAESYNSTVSFIGSVGIMYPSDYGYAALASDCERSKVIYMGYYETAECHNNNWLFQGSSQWQWLISPDDTQGCLAGVIWDSGGVSIGTEAYTVGGGAAYSPVMALSSGVIVMGSGTKADPYTIVN